MQKYGISEQNVSTLIKLILNKYGIYSQGYCWILLYYWLCYSPYLC